MSRLLRIVNRIEDWTLVLIILGLAFIAFVQVVCRYVLGFSFTWMEELGRSLAVFIAFLGASIGVREGAHFSMDLVYEKVPNDRFRHGLQVLVHGVSAAIFVVVAWYGLEQVMKLRGFGVLTSAMRVPKYWAYVPISFFSAIMALRSFVRMGTHVRAVASGEPFSMGGTKP
jgi:C4-dicarboxylate transporter, DctQ subunit